MRRTGRPSGPEEVRLEEASWREGSVTETGDRDHWVGGGTMSIVRVAMMVKMRGMVIPLVGLGGTIRS
jgi:hypothetical protein